MNFKDKPIEVPVENKLKIKIVFWKECFKFGYI